MKPISESLLSKPDGRQRFLVFAVIYIAIWGCTWYSARIVEILGSASVWFLPAGLRFACILLLGWPGLLLEMVANLVFTLLNLAMWSTPIPPFFSVKMFWAVFDWYALPLAYAVVILPARRWLGESWDLSRPAHNVLFNVTALGASTVSALTGTFHLLQVQAIAPTQWSEVFVSWVTGDFIGIVTLSPLLLVRVWPGLRHYLERGCWRNPLRPNLDFHSENISEDTTTTLMAVSGLLLVMAIPLYLGIQQHLPLIALLLLFMLASVALRSGLHSAVLAVVLLDSGMVLIMALFGQRELALQYQLVMIAFALVGLWLGGAVESRNRITARYQDFATVSNDLLWETDGEGCLLSANGPMAKEVGLSVGQSWRDALVGGAQQHLAVLEDAIGQHQPFNHLEIPMHSGSDEPRWIQINGLPVWDESGELTGYRGTASDVTRAHRAEALLTNYNKELLEEVAQSTLELRHSNSELAIKEQHLQVLLAAAPVGVMELDGADCCRYLNVDGARLTGYSAEQAKGRHFLDFVHPDERDKAEHTWSEDRSNNQVQWMEFRLNRSNLWCAAYWITTQSADGPVGGTIVTLVDQTSRHQEDERLWNLAHHDPLTNLPNRQLFWDRLAQALSLAKRRESAVTMLWLDLDGFKAVNDNFGHAAGDALLQQVAQRISSRVRDSDTVARMGGDEFAVIMPDITDSASAVQVANELFGSLKEIFSLPQGNARISGSIGVAVYPLHAQTAESLTQCADMAMYRAKNAGKSQVCVWGDEIAELATSEN